MKVERVSQVEVRKTRGDGSAAIGDSIASATVLAHPLTPLQAGMIYESVLAGAPSVNLEQIVVRMTDDAGDEALLREVWAAAAARHAALRSVIDWSAKDGPRQIVLAEVAPTLSLHDWSAERDAEGRLSVFLASDRARGVDAAQAPAWRLALIRMPGKASALIWTFPHSLLDGRSFTIVLEEVFEHYDARKAGCEVPRFPARPEFADHCAATAELAADFGAAHFRGYLDGMQRPNAVGLGLAAGTGQGKGGAVTRLLERRLSAEDTALLVARTAQAGATLATAVSAAWGIVLARGSGQADAVFGMTRSGRFLHPKGEQMVGCLITTVPLRVRLAPDLSLDTLLQRIRDDQVAMRPYEHASLTAIKTATDLLPDQPLFETLVMFERKSLSQRMMEHGDRWAKRRVSLHEEGALPLTLAAYGDDELSLRLEHDRRCVSDAAAERYIGYLVALLRAMARSPAGARVADLAFLPKDELARLKAFATPDHPVDVRQTADPLAGFAAQVAARPQAWAVRAADGRGLSFGQLDRASNRLAHVLRQRGLGPGHIVGLCLKRSPDYIVALLAVLKTGAAFLPLDPAYPDDALTHMVADSGAAPVLTDGVAPWMAAFDALELTAALTAGMPDSALEAEDWPQERAAYVIYTSGTTGRPKGVAVPVSAMAAHAVAATRAFGLSPADRVLQFTSLNFDVSVEEIVPTLLCGGTVVLRSEVAAQAPRALLDLCEAERVSVLNLPTGFWQALLDDMELSGSELPASVRLVIAGGEQVPAAAVRRWRARVPDLPFINGYGPTEATITSAAFKLAADAADHEVPQSDVPVGRPLGHARLYVLAADRTLAPIGAVGELWIGGPCVALGYLGRAELTAERFLPDPFRPGGRMYRSGDLAWWDGAGQLHLAGRSDRQVKLRGYRIEPAEVERVLESLPGVGQAVVGILDAGKATARLIAWLRPAAAGVELDPAEISAAAEKVLPAQIRPQIVPVTDWPMRSGGKIDISRLPRPDPTAAAAEATCGDLDETTQKICAIFADLLSLTSVGPDQSFLDLGGHSLLMVRLIGQIEALTGQRLPVAQLRAHPTPRGIVRLLSGQVQKEGMSDCVVPIQPSGHRPPIYGVHVLGVNGSYYRPLARAMGPEQPIFGLTVGLLNEDTPTGVAETAALYHSVIDAHQPEGPLCLVAVSLGSYVTLELAQRLLAAGRDVRMLAMLDAEGPGGRGRIRGWARLRAHLRKLGRNGPSYLGQTLCYKLENARHWYEKLRLVLSGQMGRPQAPASSVAAFVAANELAVQAYRARPYRRRLTIIRAEGNVFDSPETIAAGLGWNIVAAGGLDVIDVPGDHLSIMDEPNVRRLAEVLRKAMDA